jgi:23S rRNA (guanosine2251-2'-O)-methyltransferase
MDGKGRGWRGAGGGRSGGRRRPDHKGRLLHDRADDAPSILYGWHTVAEALRNPARRFRRLMTTENALARLVEEGMPLPVAPDVVRPWDIDALVERDAVHQGLYAETDPLPVPTLKDLAAGANVLLVLDQITDPHNVGAILRSAAAFDVAAVITTARHSPQMTGVLAKAASGALDLVPLVLVQNLARTLDSLKADGVLVVGLDSEGADDLAQVALRAPVALVLGAEGKGLRQLTRATCDVLARLDMPGRLKSLNVSNAAAVALYATRRALSAGTSGPHR